MERENYFFILNEHEVINVKTFEEWSEWWVYNEDARVVNQTGNEKIQISTVFVGLNIRVFDKELPPLLFETVVFGGEHDGTMCRYSTWEDAEKGHNIFVSQVFPMFVR